MSDEKKFVEGLFVKEKELKYGPLTELSFNVDKFTAWIEKHCNEKGYVNVTIAKSKEGKPYAKLNDWKPDNKNDQKQEDLDDKSLPF
jgi:hypothetical protein